MTIGAMDKIRIVIIEDHHATRRGLEFEINCEPDVLVVGTAATHSEGFELVRTVKPDVVLLDLHLPDSTGPKSLVSQYCSVPDVAVVVFSGETRAAIFQIVLECGVKGYLSKSEPVPQVVSAVRRIMQGEAPVISEDLQQPAGRKLTSAERHLLRLLARGMKYHEIAAQRVTSPETVRKQVDQLVDKLSLDSREELIAWSVDSGYGKLELE